MFTFMREEDHNPEIQKKGSRQPKFIWKTNEQVNYNSHIRANLNSISESFQDAILNDNCELSLQILMNAIYSAADSMKIRNFNRAEIRCSADNRKSWFDKECQKLRMEVIRALRNF